MLPKKLWFQKVGLLVPAAEQRSVQCVAALSRNFLTPRWDVSVTSDAAGSAAGAAIGEIYLLIWLVARLLLVEVFILSSRFQSPSAVLSTSPELIIV